MIPNSLAPSGIVWGTIQMALSGALSYFSLVTLVKMLDVQKNLRVLA